jgi:adsorption protein B
MTAFEAFSEYFSTVSFFLFVFLFLALLLLQSIFTLDDLFLDFCAFIFNIKPQEISAKTLHQMGNQHEKKVAIVIANWKEDEILFQVVSGNLERLKYKNYSIFIGVYPNDEKTWAVARMLESHFQQVQVIVNSKNGPTSKGQLLNVMTDHIIQYNSHFPNEAYELIVLQDSEDIIHPFSLQVFNHYSRHADFIQIPVYSFSRSWKELIGSTYMDEFSEAHTKDLLVRQKLGAAIPSCGVGTALSRASSEI